MKKELCIGLLIILIVIIFFIYRQNNVINIDLSKYEKKYIHKMERMVLQ